MFIIPSAIPDFTITNILIGAVTGFMVIKTVRWYQDWRLLPPGPSMPPFIGIIPILYGSFSGERGMELARQYKSDIVSFRMMGQIMVILNSYEAIKEYFSKRQDIADRIKMNILQIANPNHGGLIMASGDLWRETRRFTLHMMRDFGMGKAVAEEIVVDEAEKCLKFFAATQGVATDPRTVINMAVSNNICQFALGERFQYDDPCFQNALHNLNTFVHKVSSPGNMFILRFRLGRYLYRDLHRTIQHHFNVFAKFIDEKIAKHRENYKGTINDMIDGYLNELSNEDTNPEYFNDFQLRCLITDLFAAGSETTHTTLRWLLLYMAVYQDVQARVYKDIMSKVGDDRYVSMMDRKNLVYTDAVIHEVQRFNTVFQLGLLHTNAREDFWLGKYKLKKGTPVASNIRAVHREPKTWKYPERFDPNNFLQDGKLVNLDRFIPFSIGRRQCAGEALAVPEVFIFFTTWMQKFHVALPKGEEPDLDPNPGIGVRQPKPYKLIFTPRKGPSNLEGQD